ncbi:hypothetical protein C8Q69DRAFT_528700 [Paecilomyces variotii]|uniref:Armadillo-type protein n=1 Tax=Byssochlamys spectabilis TaxID=264951 RepID=A0A443HS53_BYSSP|nr:hypothetical protein C8Q69DRAFT_528700 [Paecilomyces variotii]KAJ9365408.1 hypothetical protein DTO280E4_377 [Paecilomyces variotii]RWQ94617.1 hypothetical protein C8Q69DRAFT_528700 [Paecilomyces variotii]
MDALRSAAREYLKKADRENSPEFDPDGVALPDGLDTLSRDILDRNLTSHQETCESLLVAQASLRAWGSKSLSETDRKAANDLYGWLGRISLPSSEFADALEVAYSADKEKHKPLTDSLKDSRFRLSLGISVISSLSTILPIEEASNVVDIVTTLASFTSERDPWTTQQSCRQALEVLDTYVSRRRSDDASSLWSTFEDTLKTRIKPLFAKTKNPAITSTGRKNLHPMPATRFDYSSLDPETKPWKYRDVYCTTVFSWILSIYQPSDTLRVEGHFPLLVPPILSLIDDENISFKTRGCNLLSKLLVPLREGKSDILRRTNLSSVFEDAITPCLLSLPTITPEEESLQLLGAAYSALLSVLKTRYPQTDSQSSSTKSQSRENDKTAYIHSITQILRISLIPSFHHISSNTPTASSSIASFPYPRLSTFLLQQLSIISNEVRIHLTKHLQDIIPLLYSTLTNPFGTAYIPLLLAATTATRSIILNAHPRIWRWRGEILGGICTCWLHVLEEEKEIAHRIEKDQDQTRPVVDISPSAQQIEHENGISQLERLKNQLQGCAYLLKVVLISVSEQVKVDGKFQEDNWLGLTEDIDVEKEFMDLVTADEDLRGLLFVDISPGGVEELFG